MKKKSISVICVICVIYVFTFLGKKEAGIDDYQLPQFNGNWAFNSVVIDEFSFLLNKDSQINNYTRSPGELLKGKTLLLKRKKLTEFNSSWDIRYKSVELLRLSDKLKIAHFYYFQCNKGKHLEEYLAVESLTNTMSIKSSNFEDAEFINGIRGTIQLKFADAIIPLRIEQKSPDR